MKSKLVLIGIILLGLWLSACTTHLGERPPNGAELYSYGREVYLEYCAECHQTSGTGVPNLIPRLAANPVVTLHDPEPIIDTVLYGQGSMTGFSERLTSDDIAAVLTYIRNTWGNHATPVSPRQVH